MAPRAAVAPAPSSSSNSQPPRRNLAYPLLDLHPSIKIKTPMSSIPNPSTRNARKDRTFLRCRRRRRRVLPGAAAPRGGRSRGILLGPPGRGRRRRRRGLRLVKDHKFRSVSRRVKSGGGDVGFLDPRGGGARCSHLGPLRGRHGRGGRRRGRALPGGRGAPASLHHGVRRRRGFPLRSAPLVSLPPPSFPPPPSSERARGILSRGFFFSFLRKWFC
jgi:hypothetical protein